MSDDQINIEVDGVQLKARKGQMLIEVTDLADIYVPRFCYHPKLSIAANCRMCLVEVEKAPKPLPACATPVMDGMKVFTRSPKAIDAQRATMEFLLINHPLDCPICDQGGECELQDLAMGFGRGVSRFTESKRVVKDKNLGPLVSTDMTRCIQCTRCVRFEQEIAGIQELGTVGRGELMEITTYIEKSIDHELSANIIDVCPVGALNNKPYRYRARAWEMRQHATVAPHDCVGSNIFVHTLRGEAMRVVPRPNEEINETWITDRDRFSVHGIYSSDRLESPMIKREGRWQRADWRTALSAAAEGLARVAQRHGSTRIGALASPTATLEELYLVARLMRGIGSPNIDHRLRQVDFRDQQNDPAFPWLGSAITEVETLDALLVVGSNIRYEAPILAHRVRKAALGGARVSFLNPAEFEYLFPIATYIEAAVGRWVGELAAVVKAAGEISNRNVPEPLAESVSTAQLDPRHRGIAEWLNDREHAAIWLGHLAQRHPAFADLRALAATLAEMTGARLGYLPEGANGVGAVLAGVLPHREIGGRPFAPIGFDAGAMLSEPLEAYLLFGGIEPERDTAAGGVATDSLRQAEWVVAATPFGPDDVMEVADVVLPIGTFAETSGTFVNVGGTWQSFAAAANAVAESRPGWKVLRVLGNLLDLEGFTYSSSEQIRDELKQRLGELQPDNRYTGDHGPDGASRRGHVVDVPIYATDALVRRSVPLQQTRDGRTRPVTY